ncbi:MAG: radical SAM protein [Nitrospinae bacterium]|nr:radical SAM protein [Nitrospinota bacterium]
MDKFRIDSHKLMFHPKRVSEWLDGKNIYPIYMEISPSGPCNHRCTYCGKDFMGYQKRYLDTKIFMERLTEMGALGLKSIMYAGDGEPFLHKDIAQIIVHTKKSGIDVGITTNAVLFKEEIADEILGHVEWIKVSINAGTPDTYSKVHRTKPADFDKAVKNMVYAKKVRDEKGYRCTLGMQMILLPENHAEAVTLARVASDAGMDYLVIKPYSQMPNSITHQYENVKYTDYMYLGPELEKLNTPDFRVIFRSNAMQKWDEGSRNYKKCHALPFWSYIDAGGFVWGCAEFLLDERFKYGNINDNTFKEIWEGEARMKSLKWVHEELDLCECRLNCRMDAVNRYIWDLKNPIDHVNFI